MTDIVTASVKGIVRNPTAATVSVGTESQLPLTAHGAMQTSDIHGKWFEANYRGKLFTANVTAQTVPVIASGLVSVFTLYNPAGSGIIAEIISTGISQVVAATVVDSVGWYSSTAAATAAGTFTTLGVPRSGQVQGANANSVRFYSAYTHSLTPTREDIICDVGASTNTTTAVIEKIYDGRLLLPAGIAMSVAMSTTAGSTSGLDIQATWAEWPA